MHYVICTFKMPKHIPIRTCVACRENRPKREMVRVVRGTDGTVFLDPKGKANGRGAYICRRVECWEKAIKRNSLKHALKVDIEPAVLENLRDAAQTAGFEDEAPMNA
jgi:predicted RNA-binding protein YlxR (DUF448 family)